MPLVTIVRFGMVVLEGLDREDNLGSCRARAERKGVEKARATARSATRVAAALMGKVKGLCCG